MLKKENKKMILFHPKLGRLDLSLVDKEFLAALEKERGYAHLFEIKIKNKKDGNS